MWSWARFGIKRQAGPSAADVLRIAQVSLDEQREALERRVQLAVAETVSRTERALDEHREAVEQRMGLAVADTTSWAQSILDEHREATERRAQLAIAEATALATRLLEERREAVERRVQLAVAEAFARAKSAILDETSTVEARLDALRQEFGRAVAESRLGVLESVEPRIQLAISEAVARTEERFSEVARDSRNLRQHVPGLLNATATVRALSFQLSSLRAAQEETKAHSEQIAENHARWGEVAPEIEALSRRVREMSETDERQRASSHALLEERLSTTDQRNEHLAAFLARFENALIGREGDYQTLREQSDRTRAELEDLAAAAERAVSDLDAVRERIEAVRGDTHNYTDEVRQLRTALAEVRTDRDNLRTATEQATRSIGDLRNRIESVRNEILHEAGYGEGAGTRSVRIVDENKVEAARKVGDVRLNLRSGDTPLADYLNVDVRDLPGVDVVADAGDLPFEPGTVSEIASRHALEHFDQEELRRLLPYWRGLLKPEGVFRAVVPDGEAMLARQAAGDDGLEESPTGLFGAEASEGDSHFSMFTPDSLGQQLTDAGFRDVSVPVRGRKNDTSFEFEITAIAP